MKILILNHNSCRPELVEYFQRKGHSVDDNTKLTFVENLSDYDVCFAHPFPEDYSKLYEEANNRKEFKLVFYDGTPFKNEVDTNRDFPNKNVFFEGLLSKNLLNYLSEEHLD